MTIDTSRVRLSGPLKPFGAGFATELSRQGYTPNSALLQIQLLAHLSRWLECEGLDPHGLLDAELERFLDTRRAAGYTHYLTVRALRPMFTYLCSLGVIPPPSKPTPDGPAEMLLERYRLHLTVERGLVPTSARVYVDSVRPFLSSRFSSDGLDLDQLSASDVTAFVVARCSEQASGSVKLTVTALRSLLRFMHLEGVIEQPLAEAVPSVAGWRLSGLPKGLEPAQVQSLLESCNQDTVIGCRDFAILTMLARFGLRAGELAGLRLDDVDWRAGEIVVRGKGGRAERLPLPVDIGAAMVTYLHRGRPPTAEGRTIFVRVRAPHHALCPSGVSQVVVAAGRRAGLGLIHAHRLRHAAATAMLRSGAPLNEIGQLLRHRRTLTTAIYAKVDREALRTIAHPWPGGES